MENTTDTPTSTTAETTAETTTSGSNELLVLEKHSIENIFKEGGLDPILQSIENTVKTTVLDVTTKKGRKEIASLAAKIARSKTALDNAGKDLVSGIKAKAKVIDNERKKAREFLDELKEETRKPLTEFEEKEKQRVAELEQRIQNLRNAAQDIPSDSASIQEVIDRLNVTDPDTFEEFQEQAAGAKSLALTKLTIALDDAKKREQEQAELEQLRREKEEREQKEREEQIRKEEAERVQREAEEKAERERREAEERAAQEKREAAEAHQAELDRQRQEQEEKARKEAEAREAEARAEIEAAQKEAEENRRRLEAAEREKQERIERENAERLEREQREADEKHRETVRKNALADLIGNGLPQASADLVLKAIAAGKIRNVSITY